MTTPERCPVCDAVLATRADEARWLAAAAEAIGRPTHREPIVDLIAAAPLPRDRCWHGWWGGVVRGHAGPPVDWRARALAAEAERDAAEANYRFIEHAAIRWQELHDAEDEAERLQAEADELRRRRDELALECARLRGLAERAMSVCEQQGPRAVLLTLLASAVGRQAGS